jgi:hypothetical protein
VVSTGATGFDSIVIISPSFSQEVKRAVNPMNVRILIYSSSFFFALRINNRVIHSVVIRVG